MIAWLASHRRKQAEESAYHRPGEMDDDDMEEADTPYVPHQSTELTIRLGGSVYAQGIIGCGKFNESDPITRWKAFIGVCLPSILNAFLQYSSIMCVYRVTFLYGKHTTDKLKEFDEKFKGKCWTDSEAEDMVGKLGAFLWSFDAPVWLTHYFLLFFLFIFVGYVLTDVRETARLVIWIWSYPTVDASVCAALTGWLAVVVFLVCFTCGLLGQYYLLKDEKRIWEDTNAKVGFIALFGTIMVSFLFAMPAMWMAAEPLSFVKVGRKKEDKDKDNDKEQIKIKIQEDNDKDVDPWQAKSSGLKKEDRWRIKSGKPIYAKVLDTMYIALPKFAFALAMMVIGGKFIVWSKEFSEVILNSLALLFVLELDELIFTLILSSKDNQAVENIPPISVQVSKVIVTVEQKVAPIIWISLALFLTQWEMNWVCREVDELHSYI